MRFLLPLLWASILSASNFDHSDWDRVLKTYVSDSGEVDYAAIKGNRQDLDAYVNRLADASPENQPDKFPGAKDQLAYWMNAYNAFVTQAVVDAYPIMSVRRIGPGETDFFVKKHCKAGGRLLSLQDIETNFLRKVSGDPRIHFAIVCASLSCPRLSHDAFSGGNVESQLDFLTRQFFSERRNLSVDALTREVTLSMILTWYKSDFQAGQSSLVDYAKRYAPPRMAELIDGIRNPKVKFREYDWAINDAGSRSRSKSPVERELTISR